MKIRTVGLDLAKSRSRRMVWMDGRGEAIPEKATLARAGVAAFRKTRTLPIGIQTRGGARRWARKPEKLGHTIKHVNNRYNERTATKQSDFQCRSAIAPV